MLENLFRNMPGVVKNLLLLNVVMFVLKIAMPAIGVKLMLYYFDSPLFEPYQIVTSVFMHADIGHLFFNMFGLVMFGSLLEKRWGAKRFLLFYLFSALGGFLLKTLANYIEFQPMLEAINEYIQTLNPQIATDFLNEYFYPYESNLNSPDYIDGIKEFHSNVLKGVEYSNAEDALKSVYYLHTNTGSLGASGAIMGLLAAFAYLFPNTELMLLFFPVPVKAKYFVPVMMIIELYLGVNNFEWDNIGHFAHLGGALFGFILVFIWQRDKTRMY